MSTSHPFADKRDQLNDDDDYRKLLSPREQLLGQIIVMLICLLVILLRSM